jgi:hypothetical protein
VQQQLLELQLASAEEDLPCLDLVEVVEAHQAYHPGVEVEVAPWLLEAVEVGVDHPDLSHQGGEEVAVDPHPFQVVGVEVEDHQLFLVAVVVEEEDHQLFLVGVVVVEEEDLLFQEEVVVGVEVHPRLAWVVEAGVEVLHYLA